MDILERAASALAPYPHLAVERRAKSISVAPPDADGFSVTLYADGNNYEVAFDSWHEDFDSPDEALNCFMFGLSEACRLKVVSRGSFDYQWVLEYRADDRWIEESVTGLFIFPFWRRRNERHLQNRVLDAERWRR